MLQEKTLNTGGVTLNYAEGPPAGAPLVQLTCPVLLIQGDPALGSMVADEDAEQALSLLAHGSRKRIKGVGHNLGLDAGEASPLLRATTDFLESL
jgi:pimeloyl-ACP methyl ester carboxylesterase